MQILLKHTLLKWNAVITAQLFDLLIYSELSHYCKIAINKSVDEKPK